MALMEHTGQTYMDLTRKFVAPSSSGNNYIMIIYDYDSNTILAIPLKNCKADSILAAYKIGHARLCAAGLQPKLQCLDNEASCALQDFLTTELVDYQLAPPHLHRCTMQQKEQSGHSKTTSSPVCAVWTKIFQLHYEIDSSHKQNSL